MYAWNLVEATAVMGGKPRVIHFWPLVQNALREKKQTSVTYTHYQFKTPSRNNELFLLSPLLSALAFIQWTKKLGNWEINYT